MAKKWTYDKIREYVNENAKGYELLDIKREENGKIRVYVKCDKGHTYDTNFDDMQKNRRCRYCYGNVKFTYEKVKNFIEQESQSGCRLISDKYLNVDEKLEFECKCGKKYTTTFYRFKNGNKRTCRECSNERLKELFRHSYDYVARKVKKLSDGNCRLIGKEYIDKKTKLKLECSCGNRFDVIYGDFITNKQYQCPECGEKNRVAKKTFSYAEVKQYIESFGYELLSENYLVSSEKLKIKCPKGHTLNMTYNGFRKGSRCRTCYYESRRGENAYNWKGGISSITEYLRYKIKEWKNRSKKESNYKCVITGTKFDVIHHLYSFNKIVQEVFEITNIEVYETIGDYSKEELQILENKLIELHKKYPLGVCLNGKIHGLFHSIYGRGDNKPEEFEEFKKRYYSGEFDDKLEKELKSFSLNK
ncbi:hypothetical protein [Tepidibacter hydrothermalis]|uniref:Uncharacterized protein n=1 Tax=Tepidibacter hydrothermalis TaxID=3036126 RepID=A0ABY8E822_9FIRM|nr:hypothetical protein [Tepidibacter hydrothermalis]WFD09041.1 hypothetical protein P4S50_11655 [Tepidibacter hydrothermalis]